MPDIYCDYTQTSRASVTAFDTSGAPFDADDAVVFHIVVPGRSIETLMSQYNPESGTSPLVATARPLARVILDALRRLLAESGQ